MKKPPRLGERVKVRFGPYEEEGEVFRVEGKGEMTWVTVELFLDSKTEPTLMTYLLGEVEPAQAA
jgi:hypothetical protein